MGYRFETRLRAAVSGPLAVIGGLSVGELTAIPLSRLASPFQAVAAFLVDHSPAPAREWAIDTFGTNDKLALMIGVGLAVAVQAVLAGILQVVRPPAGAVIVVLVALFGVVAAATRPTATAAYVIPSIVAGVVAVALLVLLCRGARGSRRGPEQSGPSLRNPLSRRGLAGHVEPSWSPQPWWRGRRRCRWWSPGVWPKPVESSRRGPDWCYPDLHRRRGRCRRASR